MRSCSACMGNVDKVLFLFFCFFFVFVFVFLVGPGKTVIGEDHMYE